MDDILITIDLRSKEGIFENKFTLANSAKDDIFMKMNLYSNIIRRIEQCITDKDLKKLRVRVAPIIIEYEQIKEAGR